MRHVFESLVHDVDRRILKGEPLDAILTSFAENLAASYDYPLVQISLKGGDGEVEIRTAAGREAEFLRDIIVRWDDHPNGHGPTGTAIRVGSARVARVADDHGFAMGRDRGL